MDLSAPNRDASDSPVTRHARRALLFRTLIVAATLAAVLLPGCTPDKKEEKSTVTLAPKYPVKPPKANLPVFMKGTVFELTDVDNKVPYLVSGYGLVVGLDNTGNNDGIPMAVRNYMYDQMVQHGFGGTIDESLRALKPAKVLSDPRTSVVEVYGFLPPGARSGDQVDLFVQTIATSRTKSLARGVLYMTDLRDRGVDPIYPRAGINVYIKGRGPVFVNPTYVAPTSQPSSSGSLRSGIVMRSVFGPKAFSGGVVMQDRHLVLQLRQPQLSMSLAIQDRIRQRFQDDSIARTQDEGIIYVIVPRSFKGDWQHFMGVVTHLYMNASPGAGVMQARELAKEAVKPDAPLQDISYCWEAIGEEALPAVQGLYGSASPDVAFAAARAGAFIGDTTAVDALALIAATEGHPFQLNAVKVLGALRESPRITKALSELLASKNALVRIEAYEILARQEAPVVQSHVVRDRFVIDRVQCEGEPMIYATRSGTPRIAIFGQNAGLKTPIMFSAMDDEFTITSSEDGKSIVMFDRSTTPLPGGAQARISPDLYDMIRRLGGDSNDGFAFEYSDIVGLLQAMVDRHYIPASFVLQDSPNLQEAIEEAPPIAEPTQPGPAAGSDGVGADWLKMPK